MRYFIPLFILTVILYTLILKSHAETKLVTVDDAKYAFNVMHPSAETKTPIAVCILDLELNGTTINLAAKKCLRVKKDKS